jgi:hypothetical protein
MTKKTVNRKLKITTLENFAENFHIGIDYDTGAEMKDLEMKDLAKQSRWCYQKYRRADKKVQCHMLGLGNKENVPQSRLQKLFEAHSIGWKTWDVHNDKSVEDYVKNGEFYIQTVGYHKLPHFSGKLFWDDLW